MWIETKSLWGIRNIISHLRYDWKTEEISISAWSNALLQPDFLLKHSRQRSSEMKAEGGEKRGLQQNISICVSVTTFKGLEKKYSG